MPPIILETTQCPICGPGKPTQQVYAANFTQDSFNTKVFSARRTPDQIHYRIVKCSGCGLIRSDEIADSTTLKQLYSKSTVTYSDETSNLKKTYARYLKKTEKYSPNKGSILEIGCGNGFFLEEAEDHGYQDVYGIEASESAITLAKPHLRPKITCDVMHEGIFGENKFDLICMFQLFDHIAKPKDFLKECFRIMKPSGLILCLNHDISALATRILGRKSPVIDIEHTFFYSPKTINKIFSFCGFKVLETKQAINTCSLQHLLKLFPFPQTLKDTVLKSLPLGVKKFNLALPLGNLYLIARKP